MLKFAILILATSFVCCHFFDVEDDSYVHPQLRTSKDDKAVDPNELNPNYWANQAQIHIKSKLVEKLNNGEAKNIIMFLGDGMSIHTITATRAYLGNENKKLSFEYFPYFGLSKTYCVDKQVPDSACTSTAYLTGIKNNYGTIGVNAKVPRGDCMKGTIKESHSESIAKWAQNSNKSTGFVTTARVTHASPAGLYAHTADRYWENDKMIRKAGCDPTINMDIAKQLIHSDVGSKLNVILGGGRAEFRDEYVSDEENQKGYRSDGKDLIQEWLNLRSLSGQAVYAWNREKLFNVDVRNTDYLLGLFSPDHCPFHGDIKRNSREKLDPTLTEMTEVAIKMLKKNKNGYFLFVESGRIDMAHHETRARKALEDTEEFSKAVQKAVEMTSSKDTLIIVTSDHSHTMTINGYPSRGKDILGLSGNLDDGNNKLPYTTLSYANGLGFYKAFKENGGGRRDISKDNFEDPEYEYMATIPLESETHGAEDVGIFATGPKAHLFVGNYEQNNIPILIAHAAQIGPFAEYNHSEGGANSIIVFMPLIIASVLLIFSLQIMELFNVNEI